MRLDVEHRRAARLREQHAQAEPGEVRGAEPLHRAECRRVGGQQRGDAGDRQPHQHLVAGDHAHRRGEAAADPALAGRRDQREVAGSRDHQEDNHRDDERAVIRNPEHRSLPPVGTPHPSDKPDPIDARARFLALLRGALGRRLVRASRAGASVGERRWRRRWRSAARRRSPGAVARGAPAAVRAHACDPRRREEPRRRRGDRGGRMR